MSPSSAGKGSKHRPFDIAKKNEGHDRIFGAKIPWWELRDEKAKTENLKSETENHEDPISQTAPVR